MVQGKNKLVPELFFNDFNKKKLKWFMTMTTNNSI